MLSSNGPQGVERQVARHTRGCLEGAREKQTPEPTLRPPPARSRSAACLHNATPPSATTTGRHARAQPRNAWPVHERAWRQGRSTTHCNPHPSTRTLCVRCATRRRERNFVFFPRIDACSAASASLRFFFPLHTPVLAHPDTTEGWRIATQLAGAHMS